MFGYFSSKITDFLKSNSSTDTPESFLQLNIKQLETLSKLTTIPCNQLHSYFIAYYAQEITPSISKVILELKYDLLKQIQLNDCLLHINQLSQKQIKDFIKLSSTQFKVFTEAPKFLQIFIKSAIQCIRNFSIIDFLTSERTLAQQHIFTENKTYREEFISLVYGLIEQIEVGEEEFCMEEEDMCFAIANEI
ncbi:hypothetical protein SS50377_24490 [Spironucleus salmonicida]|uniref:Uncharacterized protein n=1 Tax=Spironucleus salmonicida TaxID=348837 RepID=V6LMV8_9EUKA|nr:hypothetical protein SS50377_24490 [Spironucleus salmonicida]|eukprot:EST45965.1 Hypothetical protein SS50377_13944 [Spironucleus salmonicida]